MVFQFFATNRQALYVFNSVVRPVSDSRARCSSSAIRSCASSTVLASRSRLSCRSRLSSCSSVWRFSFSSLSCSALSVASRVASSSAAFSGRSSRRLAFSSRKRAFSTWARCSSNRQSALAESPLPTSVFIRAERTGYDPTIHAFECDEVADNNIPDRPPNVTPALFQLSALAISHWFKTATVTHSDYSNDTACIYIAPKSHL